MSSVGAYRLVCQKSGMTSVCRAAVSEREARSRWAGLSKPKVRCRDPRTECATQGTSTEVGDDGGGGPDWPGCLRGEVAEGLSLVIYADGTIDELTACSGEFDVTAIYALADGAWVSYILGAPEVVHARFRELFPDGVPVATPLTVRGEGP